MAISKKLSAKEITELKAIFKDADLNEDGKITKQELKKMLVAIGQPIEDADRMLANADISGDGVVDFDEFCEYKSPKLSAEEINKMKELFAAADLNKDGKITKKELKKMLEKIGRPVADADRMMAWADADGDGIVNFAEFCRSEWQS
jgi:Ca2+-binding EF-hand superfamily protein